MAPTTMADYNWVERSFMKHYMVVSQWLTAVMGSEAESAQMTATAKFIFALVGVLKP